MRPYIDSHNHIGRTIDRVPPVGQNTAMCLTRFAQTSVHAAVSMPTAVGSPIARGIVDIRHQNEVIARACRDFPGVFPIGLALIEQRFGKLGIEEAEKAMSELGLVGVVGHPPVSSWCIPFVEAATAREGLVNLHMTDPLMDQIAGMFPRCTFICHASSWGAENLAKYDNIFFEVVQYPDGTGSEWNFDWLADKVGRERLIFGADLPYYDYRILQKTLEEAPVDDDLKDRIAHKNLEALIQRFNSTWSMPDAPPREARLYDPDQLWAVNPDRPGRLTVFA